MVRITVVAGKEKFIYDYEGLSPLTIGRLPSCNLPVTHTDVSREHCSIHPDRDTAGGFRLKDHASRNGVFVNGERSADAPLKAGDVITLAPDVKLTFGEAPAPAPAPKPAPAAPVESKPAAKEPEKAPAPTPADSGSGETVAVEESPAERAKRLKAERRRSESFQSNALLIGILVFLAAIGGGVWVFVIPAVTQPQADVAQAPEGATDPAAGGGDGVARPSTELILDAKRRGAEDEKEWVRLERLDLEPELMAASFDAFAKRFPTSSHAREALTRATSLRKVKGAGGAGAGESKAVVAALDQELEALIKAGSFADAYYLASAAPRLGVGDKATVEKAAKRVETAAYEKFTEARGRARDLAKEGRPFDAYEFLAVQGLPLRRLPFFGEVETELIGLKRAVASALESGGGRPTADLGDRSALERLVPEGKRALVACDFTHALECYRQILALPLTEAERLEFQWRIFDIARGRQIFQEVLERIQETASSGGKKPPLHMTIYMQDHAIVGDVTDGDVSKVTVSFTLLDDSKQRQEWVRAWRDLAPVQIMEIMHGLDLGGDGLIALAGYCFEAEYELEAHAALIRIWEDKKLATFRPEAASLLRRRTSTNASVAELVPFEGRLVATADRERILAERAKAAAEAEQIKRDLAAAKREAKGELFLSRCNKLIDAGMYVEGRSGLVEVWRRFKDLEIGIQAKARWEDPFLRRRIQPRTSGTNGRDANRLSIVSMAEGFPVEKNEEQQAFDNYADRQMKILEKCDFFKEYEGYLNYYGMNLWSKDRGVSREPGAIKKDTPLGGVVNGGVYTVNNGLVKSFLGKFPGPAVGCVIGNDNASVATGGGGATAIVKGMLDVVAHEVGHAFGDVGDEYDMDPSGKPNGPKGRSTTPLPTVVIDANIMGGNQKDDIRQKAPWKHWIELGTANWTGKVVDIFEGANRTPFDTWRPQVDCRQRTSSSGYCCVCMEQMMLHLYDVVRPIDECDPKDEKVEVEKGGSVILKAICLRPKSRALDGKWELVDIADDESPDGSTVVREAKAKKLDNVRMLDLPDGRCVYAAKVTASPGIYDVVFTVSDPTPWVLVKERPGMKEVRKWRLRVR